MNWLSMGSGNGLSPVLTRLKSCEKPDSDTYNMLFHHYKCLCVQILCKTDLLVFQINAFYIVQHIFYGKLIICLNISFIVCISGLKLCHLAPNGTFAFVMVLYFIIGLYSVTCSTCRYSRLANFSLDEDIELFVSHPYHIWWFITAE